MVGTPQPLNADPGITDPARAVADAEARLLAMNGQLQALVVQPAPAVPAAAAPTAPTAAPAAAAAPPTHTVTGASGSTSADADDAHAEEHDSEEQDD